MDLSKRLQTIISMVTPGEVVADIGTDHGYVPIELVKKGVCKKGLAMDIGKGPLERAEAHIRSCRMEDQITVRLSDGMDKLSPGEADRVVIAGMGGPLMARILTDGRDSAKAAGELILSPQSELADFRRFLCEEGYVIREEVMLEEDGKYYVIFRVTNGEADAYTDEAEVYTDAELAFGKVSRVRPDSLPVRKAWLDKEIGVCKSILQELEGKESETAARRREEVLRKLEVLRQVI